MTSPSTPSEGALVAYGILAGTSRVLLPPVWDLPFLRTVRSAMFDRLARGHGVTLTAEARRVLIDLEESTSSRGVLEQAVRWAAGRFFPATAIVDATRNALYTYGAGALFHRYLTTHRAAPRDPVFNAAEAGRVHRAMRESVDIFSVAHLRALTRLAVSTLQDASHIRDASRIQRYSDAIVATVAELPSTWVDVLDETFVTLLGSSGSFAAAPA